MRAKCKGALVAYRDEVRLQILDGDVRFRRAAHREVHSHPSAGPGEQGSRRPVGERFGLGVALIERPSVDQRQDSDVLAPRGRREPASQRPGRPMLGIPAQPSLQAIPRIKQSHTVFRQELGPLFDRSRIHRPRFPRHPSRRQLAQPPVHHCRRPRRTWPVFEPQVFIDQHRHALRDQRPMLDIPRLPTPRRKEDEDHDRRP